MKKITWTKEKRRSLLRRIAEEEGLSRCQKTIFRTMDFYDARKHFVNSVETFVNSVVDILPMEKGQGFFQNPIDFDAAK